MHAPRSTHGQVLGTKAAQVTDDSQVGDDLVVPRVCRQKVALGKAPAQGVIVGCDDQWVLMWQAQLDGNRPQPAPLALVQQAAGSILKHLQHGTRLIRTLLPLLQSWAFEL